MRERLADEKGRASADTAAREAEQRLDRAQADLDAALRAFEGFDEAAARERLTELREVRDQAQDEVDQIGGVEAVETVDVGRWDDLTLDEKRDLIRATVERVDVRPGRGSDRVQVTMRGENRANERRTGGSSPCKKPRSSWPRCPGGRSSGVRRAAGWTSSEYVIVAGSRVPAEAGPPLSAS